MCFNVIFEAFIGYYLMCEYEPVTLSLINILLAVIILLLLCFLTEKICLWKTDEVNSNSLPDNKFLWFI